MSRFDRLKARMTTLQKTTVLLLFFSFLISSSVRAEKDAVRGPYRSSNLIGQGYTDLKRSAMESRQRQAEIDAEALMLSKGERLYSAVKNLWEYGNEEAYQKFIYDLTPEQRKLLREYLLSMKEREQDSEIWHNIMLVLANADNAYQKRVEQYRQDPDQAKQTIPYAYLMEDKPKKEEGDTEKEAAQADKEGRE
jgi:hypothetical protein